MRIGIVGAGVSGLVSAYLLREDQEVEVLEANDYAGGHTHTKDVELDGHRFAINTGFIVFNKPNYPQFLKLIEALGVEYQPAPMSFSVKNMRNGLEYGFATLDALFAQRKNIFSLSFITMLREISKFRKEFERLLADPESERMTLGEYLAAKGYSKRFVKDFLIPFGAAIWSAAPDKMGQFPLMTFVQFFRNHGFLSEDDLLQWYTVTGGSRVYAQKLEELLGDRVVKNARVVCVERMPDGVRVLTEDGVERTYDELIIAAHSDQALEMLRNPTTTERDILGEMPYQPNNVLLHTDVSALPQRRQTWSSWNYRIPADPCERCTVTYDMSILQSVNSQNEFLVTLNPGEELDGAKVLDRYVYQHPIYTKEGVAAQQRHAEISGVDKIHYAGAYWGYGFHEDGVRSALAACRPFGKTL